MLFFILSERVSLYSDTQGQQKTWEKVEHYTWGKAEGGCRSKGKGAVPAWWGEREEWRQIVPFGDIPASVDRAIPCDKREREREEVNQLSPSSARLLGTCTTTEPLLKFTLYLGTFSVSRSWEPSTLITSYFSSSSFFSPSDYSFVVQWATWSQALLLAVRSGKGN